MPISNIQSQSPASNATVEAVERIDAPAPTKSWHPIAHREALSLVREALDRHGLEVQRAEYGLAGKTGVERFFATLDITSRRADYGMSVGVGNSIDKSFPFRLVGGERVFVCSNLCFWGDFSIKRKHTSRLLNDLPGRIEDSVSRFIDQFHDRELEIEQWKDREITDSEAALTLLSAADRRAIPGQLIPRVWREYHEPTHQEFAPRTVWSLQNAFTEVSKQRSVEPNDSSNSMLRLTETLREIFPVSLN